MISLKKYLEMDGARFRPSEMNESELLAAAVTSYRAALLDMGKSGHRACSATGSSLRQKLSGLEGRLAGDLTPTLLRETGHDVTEQLSRWGEFTAEHLKGKAQEVKDLLLVLARTAESLGERDQRYTSQLHQFTARLRTVADLEDLTQVRSSLMHTATELKTCVDQMEQDSQRAIAELQTRVSSYETKLKDSEDLALRDTVTGLPNRLYLERSIEWRIQNSQPFCVAFLDLNHFKLVNDQYGHTAGDVLLRQFSDELKSHVRPSDLVGRWGGDEFVILLDCDLSGTAATVDRLRRWVFGDYTVSAGGETTKGKVCINAAVGIAEWASGDTPQKVIERADHAMYADKKLPARGISRRSVDSELHAPLLQ